MNNRPTCHKKSQTTLKPKQFSKVLCDALSIAGKMLFTAGIQIKCSITYCDIGIQSNFHLLCKTLTLVIDEKKALKMKKAKVTMKMKKMNTQVLLKTTQMILGTQGINEVI